MRANRTSFAMGIASFFLLELTSCSTIPGVSALGDILEAIANAKTASNLI